MVSNASVAIKEIREVGSVGIALSPHTDCLQHTSVAELLQHKFIVTHESSFLMVRLDAANKMR